MSSPSYSSGALAEIGLVSVFDATSFAPIASIEGEQEFGRFGFAISVGADGQLLIGCPRCGGEVRTLRRVHVKSQKSHPDIIVIILGKWRALHLSGCPVHRVC